MAGKGGIRIEKRERPKCSTGLDSLTKSRESPGAKVTLLSCPALEQNKWAFILLPLSVIRCEPAWKDMLVGETALQIPQKAKTICCSSWGCKSFRKEGSGWHVLLSTHTPSLCTTEIHLCIYVREQHPRRPVSHTSPEK